MFSMYVVEQEFFSCLTACFPSEPDEEGVLLKSFSSSMYCFLDQREVGAVAQGPAETICCVRLGSHQ